MAGKKYPKAGGAMVEVYVGKSIRGQQLDDSDCYLMPAINGHPPHEVKMGEINQMPKDVYDALMNCQSGTRVVDVRAAERNPRDAKSAFGNPPVRHEYLHDYELKLIKEL